MKSIVALFLLVYTTAFCQAKETQNGPIWFSEDNKLLYMQVSLVPEEDSPFHYGMWGLDRGTHIFEIDFFGVFRSLKHATICKCSNNERPEFFDNECPLDSYH